MVGATAVSSGTAKQKGHVCADSTCSGASGGGANGPNDVGGEGPKILELDLQERIVPEPMTDPEPVTQVRAEVTRGLPEVVETSAPASTIFLLQERVLARTPAPLVATEASVGLCQRGAPVDLFGLCCV